MIYFKEKLFRKVLRSLYSMMAQNTPISKNYHRGHLHYKFLTKKTAKKTDILVKVNKSFMKD